MKKISLKAKVFALLLTITALVVLVMSMMMQQGVNKGFDNYKKSLEKAYSHRLVLTLESYYEHYGHWKKLRKDPKQWHALLNKSAVKVSKKMTKPRSKEKWEVHDHKKHKKVKEKLKRIIPDYTLFNLNKKRVTGTAYWDSPGMKFKIWHNKEVVGYLLSTGDQSAVMEQDKQFAARIKKLIMVVSVVMIVLSLVLTFPIANYLTRPIKAINEATKKAAGGDYSVRTHIKRQDEMGQLANNFNRLAETLESNADIQKKQMADIAHELRTPIAVVMAELEAIQDGIHPADSAHIATMHGQISALKNLVDDLHQLSLSDLGTLRYQMEPLDLLPLVKQVVSAFSLAAEQKSIELAVKLKGTHFTVNGDHNRLHQLLNNLLQNAISYTNKGGQVEIYIEESDQHIILVIEDSEPTLSNAEINQMFDRLYRKEQSRNKKTGGSGLGLAIVKNIVKAHQGQIKASVSALGGVAMTINLPKV